jgi:hypothetical protein
MYAVNNIDSTIPLDDPQLTTGGFASDAARRARNFRVRAKLYRTNSGGMTTGPGMPFQRLTSTAPAPSSSFNSSRRRTSTVDSDFLTLPSGPSSPSSPSSPTSQPITPRRSFTHNRDAIDSNANADTNNTNVDIERPVSPLEHMASLADAHGDLESTSIRPVSAARAMSGISEAEREDGDDHG